MHRSQNRELSAERFSREARRFVDWADGSASKDKMLAPVGLRRIVALYAAALDLPQPWSEGVTAEHTPGPGLSERLNAVRARAAAIPLQHYSEIFSPLLPPEQPVVGDLGDDLVDIFRDVAAGLALYEAGSVEDAIWHWGFNFQVHWGEHASSAIRALHCYLSQEDPSGLSSAG